jgi:hypothetical protein
MLKRFLWLTLLMAGCTSQPDPSPTPTANTPTSSPQAQAPQKPTRFVLLAEDGKVTKDTVLRAPCTLMLRAEGEATVVLAAFSGNQGESPQALKPMVLHLKDREEVVEWELPKALPQARLYVTVLPNDCENTSGLVQLVDDWSHQKPRARQLVHQRVLAWEKALDRKLVHTGQPTQETGGVTSHSAFTSNEETDIKPKAAAVNNHAAGSPPPSQYQGGKLADWRPYADSVEFSADKPGVYSYPIQFSE